MKTLVDYFQTRVEQLEHSSLYHFISEDGGVEAMTYGELGIRVRAIAQHLIESGLTGKRAVLLFEPGLEYITAFFGCLCAGVVAIPAYPPMNPRMSARFNGIWKDAEPAAILSSKTIASVISKASMLRTLTASIINPLGLPNDLRIPRSKWIVTDSLPRGLGDGWKPPKIAEGALAYLQYTSGSTNNPKGVMLTHENVIANLEHIRKAMNIRPDSVSVSWLPPYHDTGLVGHILEPLYVGMTQQYILTPMHFLKDPMIWLEKISEYGAQVTGAPNFAYELCMKRMTEERKAPLKLGTLEVLYNTAEPVRMATVERFLRMFEDNGLKRKHFFTCYGLAEATLIVSALPIKDDLRSMRCDAEELARGRRIDPIEGKLETELVGAGEPLEGMTVAIVDPETKKRKAEGEVGEIWISGTDVTQGYWKNPDGANARFGLSPAGETGGKFFATGDYGLFHGTELYFVGRIKDRIKVHGLNYYPQDIEQASEQAHSMLRPSCCAAFSVETESGQRLVLVQEIKDTKSLNEKKYAEIITRIRENVIKKQQLRLNEIILVKARSVPKTSSGKIQRHWTQKNYVAGELQIVFQWKDTPDRPATKTSDAAAAIPAESGESASAVIQALIVREIAKEKGVAPTDIDARESFGAFGLDSIQIVQVIAAVERELGQKINPTLVYEHPNPAALAGFLAKKASKGTASQAKAPVPAPRKNEPAKGGSGTPSTRGDIAIIGMSGVFPKSEDLEQFWVNLENGEDLISEVPADRWDWTKFPGDPKKDRDPTPCRWAGLIDDVASFDARFFGISPKEAQLMDPQQRLFLQTAWKAIEDAGYAPSHFSGTRTGLFVGVSSSDYVELLARSSDYADVYSTTGNAHSVLANRVSYFLNFKGPSEPIDTACSSSLVAIHRAVRSIQSGECEQAVVGAVNLILTPTLHQAFSRAGMLSPDGRCRTFDQSANGYVRGEGVGAVLLKPLEQCKADGDHIYAVIKGSAVGHGGRATGLTVPNPLAQADLLVTAYTEAGVAPESIGYIEAHGTGTSLGDPIEVNGIMKAFTEINARSSQQGGSPIADCLLGSVKSNIGHLESASGIAGLIKVVLALRNQRIPKTLHVQQLNSNIDLSNSVFSIVTKSQKWPAPKDRHGKPLKRCAGVSSFGFGGANAHVVLQEYANTDAAEATEDKKSKQPQVVLLSARTEDQLWEAVRRLQDHFIKGSPGKAQPRLSDVAYTLQVGRDSMKERLAVKASTLQELMEILERVIAGEREHPGLYLSRNSTSSALGNVAASGASPMDVLLHSWIKGGAVDWNSAPRPAGEHARRISLPTYCFEKKRHWVENTNAPAQPLPQSEPKPSAHPLIGMKVRGEL